LLLLREGARDGGGGGGVLGGRARSAVIVYSGQCMLHNMKGIVDRQKSGGTLQSTISDDNLLLEGHIVDAGLLGVGGGLLRVAESPLRADCQSKGVGGSRHCEVM
jgi:hypothetical protein